MKKRLNEGLTRTECSKFSSYIIKEFYKIQKGKKRTRDVVAEFLAQIGKSNDKNAYEQLLKYAMREVKKMQQHSEDARLGERDWNLFENKINRIVERAIHEVLTGVNPLDVFDDPNIWTDANGIPRQLGDEIYRCVYNTLPKLNLSIKHQDIIENTKEYVTKLLKSATYGETQKGNGKMLIPLTGKRD